MKTLLQKDRGGKEKKKNVANTSISLKFLSGVRTGKEGRREPRENRQKISERSLSLLFLFLPFFLSLQSGEGGVSAQGIGQSLDSLVGDAVPLKAVEQICYDERWRMFELER